MKQFIHTHTYKMALVGYDSSDEEDEEVHDEQQEQQQPHSKPDTEATGNGMLTPGSLTPLWSFILLTTSSRQLRPCQAHYCRVTACPA